MSTSIAIPKRRKASRSGKEPAVPYEPTFSSSSSSSDFSSPRTPGTAPTPLAAAAASSTPEASPAATPSVDRQMARRSSYLSKSIEKAEYMVVNVGSPEAPRLISCVKSSQGFVWNQEMFLPSYAEHDAQELEHKQDPIEDIILTDEEVAKMFPQ